MIATIDRLQSEQRFHDEQAAERAAALRDDASLMFDNARYLDHAPWIRPAMAKLGELRGQRVLDFGCGHGMASVVMARAGAAVTAFDLSPGYVAETARRARANAVEVQTLVANGEALPFDADSFDAVWGCAILHHLDLATTAKQLRRILRPNGVAVFCEPWGGNRLLEFARKHLPYPGKHRTPDERPLTRRDLTPLQQEFPNLTCDGFQLFSMIDRVWPWRSRWLTTLDERLLASVPSLKNWCRYAVVTLRNSHHVTQ